MEKEKILQLWEEAGKDQRKFFGKVYGNHLCNHFIEVYEEDYILPIVRFWPKERFSKVNLSFSTRFGGVSKDYLSELNFGFDRGDKPVHVQTNFKRMCKALGISYKNLVLSDQIHDTKVHAATKEDRCGDSIEKKLQGIDGLVTKEKELCLATSYADCVPLFFFDDNQTIVGASHSGWRGTVDKIGAKTVTFIEKKFSIERKDIHVVIGPSICQSCYEVSRDVFLAFKEAYSKDEMKEIFVRGREEGKYQLDLWAANYLQLCACGILEENIHVSGLCTCCHSALFFSHRASKGKRGNLNGFIFLQQ